MDTKQLDAYIKKVIDDACKSEQRPNDVKTEYIVIDDHLLFAIKSRYQRVRRKIENLLLQNLSRNFNLYFDLVYPIGSAENIDCFQASKLDIFEQSQGVDPNHSFMEWIVFGKKHTVRSYWGLQPMSPKGNAIDHLNKLKDHGFDHVKKYPNPWEVFEKAYIAAYNEKPIDSMRKMREFYESKK